MTAPASGRDDATLRGAVVLVVAIVIGLALLARSGGGGGDDEDASGSDPTTTTTTEATDGSDTTVVPVQDSSTTTTAPSGSTQEPANITVVVLNATDETGWAGQNAEILQSAGYVTDQGNPASGENSDTTTIYATPEAQADAQAVAAVLNLADAPVTQKPAEPLGDQGQDAEADVVVVLGADSVTG